MLSTTAEPLPSKIQHYVWARGLEGWDKSLDTGGQQGTMQQKRYSVACDKTSCVISGDTRGNSDLEHCFEGLGLQEFPELRQECPECCALDDGDGLDLEFAPILI